MENLIFSNKEKFEETKRKFHEGGLSKVCLLVDFDRVLTRAFVDGQEVPSIISVLRKENYLTPDYADKAFNLYNEYRPIEEDKDISQEEKKKLMHEWWLKHFQLLIESGLNRKDIEKAVQSKQIVFRDKFSELMDFLRKHDIPLIIISSAGLGQESISGKLKNEDKLYSNIHIISNSFEWDDQGRLIAVKEPIIHSANKDEVLIKDFPEIFEKIKDRKNIILIGDSLDDVKMADSFEYDNLIKIAFLNQKTEEKKDFFKDFYDVLILNDSSLEFVLSFLNYGKPKN